MNAPTLDHNNLKPCPVCGSRAHMQHEWDPDMIEWHWIACGSCGLRTRGLWGEPDPILFQEVREAWNRRDGQ